MRLGSTEISYSEKAESGFYLKNRDAADENTGSLNCGFEHFLDRIVEKKVKETEYMVCVDKPAGDLEVGMCKGDKSIIMEDENDSRDVDDTLLPLGSKVLSSTGNIITSCAEREIDECVKVECVTVPFKEGNDLVPLNSNELDSSLKEETKSSPLVSINTCQPKVLAPTSPHKEALEYKKWSANVESGSNVDAVASSIDEDDKAVIVIKKGKRGRKRKPLKSSECNGDVRVKKEKAEKSGPHLSGRVLRSRPMTKSDSVKVDEIGLSENLVGFKRKMEAECLDQTELKEVNGKSQLTGQPRKKQKRRGRPPKAQVERESTLLHVTDDMAVFKKLERRGRPPKVQAGNLTNAKKSKLVAGKKNNNQLKGKNVKKGPKVHNGHKEDTTLNTTGENKQKMKGSKEDNDHTAGGEKRREIQQSVRDQIVSILMKAGWTVEHRPRKARTYLDAVYVDLKGGTHWSVTKAYYSLKKRIEDGKADDKEVSAFTPIPDEEISVLLRVVTKVRSDKDKPKKNKRKKNKNKSDLGTSEAEIVMSGGSEAPVKKKLKKNGNKKKKELHKSDVKLGNKSLKRQPKVSQKGEESRKPRLVARSSSKGNDEDDDGCLIYGGKRNLLSWMMDSGVVMPGGKVQYGEGRKRNGLLEGKVTRDGIHCSCCNETMDTSSFISHGGGKGKLSQTLQNLYLQPGSSFLTCLLESWRKEEESNSIRFNLVDVEGDDPNDDTCNICGDGGDLICCDGCPSTFHQTCLDIQNFPSGVWHCLYCCCKFCGLVSQMDDSQIISCCLCQEKFHRLCVKEEDASNLDSSGMSFCGSKCHELSEQLKTYIGVKFELEDGFSWTLLQRADVSKDSIFVDAPEKIECNSKLAVAFSVMDECFVPIMDERSGVNMIHDVVYNCGSNFRRLDYSGFFTAVLERGDELISAASIRIHGNRLAEMPFIGTRHMYRRQGMCRRLLDAIESALSCLGVGELVIPAIPELYKTWTTVFGFKPLTKSKRQTMNSMSMIVFPGTDILQKPLLSDHFADKNLCPIIEHVAKEDTVMKDDERSPATSHDHEVAEATSWSEHVSSARSSQHKVSVIKNTFDLNLQPASTDSDIQSNDQDSFQLSNSDNNAVLV